jgi:hypothetical protein
MKKSIKDNPKKTRGRPATGKAPLVGVRMPEEFQAEIKAWAKKQQDHPALAPAIRRLVEIGLKAHTPEPKAVGRLRKRVAGAADLAAKAVDILTLGAADADEKATRKRGLKAKGK